MEINSGVRQGDLPPATAFCLVIDTIMRELDLRGNISTRYKQISADAEDSLKTAKTKEALNKTLTKLKEEAQKLRLLINTNKTKSYEHKKSKARK
jgi:hypothetical protein